MNRMLSSILSVFELKTIVSQKKKKALFFLLKKSGFIFVAQKVEILANICINHKPLYEYFLRDFNLLPSKQKFTLECRKMQSELRRHDRSYHNGYKFPMVFLLPNSFFHFFK